MRVFEGSRVTGLHTAGEGCAVATSHGRSAPAACAGTGAFRSPVRAVRRRIVPVWDYVLVTEPLGRDRLPRSDGRNRQGVGDSANQFHYYRLTADDRILWGGYDAIYDFANGVGADLRQRDASFARLAQHFFTTFPQLEGVRFTHRWGGPIDTCSRFTAFFGTSHGGRVAYAAGHTGLGIGASRFGARVALDLLAAAAPRRPGCATPARAAPVPARAAALGRDRADPQPARRGGPRRGRRGLWLRLLDRLGLGFDS